MNASAGVVAERDISGATRLASLRSQAPMVLRPTPSALYLVGGAAGPIGGDRLTLDISVGPGATLTIRSVAAALVLPGPARPGGGGGGTTATLPSIVEVNATVATGGSLRWLPEPVIAARHCRHETRTTVRVETGGALVWREELIIGRHGEDGGSVVSRMSLDIGDRPVLRQTLSAGAGFPDWSSTAVASGARCPGSLLIVNPAWDAEPPHPAVRQGCAVLPLAGPAVQVTAVAGDSATLRGLLDWGSAHS